jgi:hypothetical protein
LLGSTGSAFMRVLSSGAPGSPLVPGTTAAFDGRAMVDA